MGRARFCRGLPLQPSYVARAYFDCLEERWRPLEHWHLSSDLVRWTPLATIWSGTSAWDDWDAHYLKSRFYRLRESGFNEDLMPRIAIQGTEWTNFMRTTPVAGALVSTSLDGQSTVTDAQGAFFLVTDTPAQGGTANYTIQVNSHAFGPYQWGDQPREQEFIVE